MTATSDKVRIHGKTHYAPAGVTGAPGGLRDTRGRFVKAAGCGTRSTKSRPHFVAADTEVTCTKCQS